MDRKLIDVDRPTMTRFGTVLIPFQDPRGAKFVVELSRAQWRGLAESVQTEFDRIDRQAEEAAAILGIERHESVIQ